MNERKTDEEILAKYQELANRSTSIHANRCDLVRWAEEPLLARIDELQKVLDGKALYCARCGEVFPDAPPTDHWRTCKQSHARIELEAAQKRIAELEEQHIRDAERIDASESARLRMEKRNYKAELEAQLATSKPCSEDMAQRIREIAAETYEKIAGRKDIATAILTRDTKNWTMPQSIEAIIAYVGQLTADYESRIDKLPESAVCKKTGETWQARYERQLAHSAALTAALTKRKSVRRKQNKLAQQELQKAVATIKQQDEALAKAKATIETQAKQLRKLDAATSTEQRLYELLRLLNEQRPADIYHACYFCSDGSDRIEDRCGSELQAFSGGIAGAIAALEKLTAKSEPTPEQIIADAKESYVPDLSPSAFGAVLALAEKLLAERQSQPKEQPITEPETWPQYWERDGHDGHDGESHFYEFTGPEARAAGYDENGKLLSNESGWTLDDMHYGWKYETFHRLPCIPRAVLIEKAKAYRWYQRKNDYDNCVWRYGNDANILFSAKRYYASENTDTDAWGRYAITAEEAVDILTARSQDPLVRL